MNNNSRVDRIVCAASFSPSSARVVEWAAAVAALYDAELRLLHVLSPPPAAQVPSSGPSSDCCGERLLNRVMALARHLPGRPRISGAVTEGDVADEVVRHARLVHADLIVIGMHSRDGSVSPLIQSIVMRAPCPVLAADERCYSACSSTSDSTPLVDHL